LKWKFWSRHLPPEPTRLPPIEKKRLVTFEAGKKELTDEMVDVKEFRLFVQNHECPVCGNGKLDLIAYEKGIEGWAAEVTCNSCLVKGIFNEGGFRIIKPVMIEHRER